MANKIQPGIPMVCEVSFYFPEQLENIMKIAKKQGFNVTYKNSLTDEWLIRHKQFIFASESSLRSQSFSLRQQATMKKFAKEKKAIVTITGRRTQENTVRSELYKTKNHDWQCHPIREWTTDMVWQYFNINGIDIPYIYKTEFGSLSGNSPFYSVNKKLLGGKSSGVLASGSEGIPATRLLKKI